MPASPMAGATTTRRKTHRDCFFRKKIPVFISVSSSAFRSLGPGKEKTRPVVPVHPGSTRRSPRRRFQTVGREHACGRGLRSCFSNSARSAPIVLLPTSFYNLSGPGRGRRGDRTVPHLLRRRGLVHLSDMLWRLAHRLQDFGVAANRKRHISGKIVGVDFRVRSRHLRPESVDVGGVPVAGFNPRLLITTGYSKRSESPTLAA